MDARSGETSWNPVATLEQAQAVVDKIIGFETAAEPGAWRSRVVLSADDECARGRCIETFIIQDTERLVELLPSAYDLRKFYLTEFPLEQFQKPEARQAFIQMWNEGHGLVYYHGHAGPNQLADEVLFLTSDVASLSNGSRLPLYFNLAKNAAFDSPNGTLGEALLQHSSGGAIAVVSSTTDGFFGPNAAFSRTFFETLFANGPFATLPCGRALQLAKNTMPQSTNIETFVLLGDPTTRLYAPEAEVTFTAPDTLLVGDRVELEGTVHLPGDTLALAGFQGEAEILLLSSVDDSGYESSTPPYVQIDYALPGVPVLSQRIAVIDGRFSFPFVVPPAGFDPDVALSMDPVRMNRASQAAGSPARPGQVIQFGPKARLRVYAWSGGQDALGAHNDILYTRTLSQAPVATTSDDDASGQETSKAALPTRVLLHQNEPNPFNPMTTIRFDLPRPAQVSLRIYDASGRLVRTLVDAPMTAGFDHRLTWNGRNDHGQRVASGIYFSRLVVGNEMTQKKMVLVQ